MSNILIFGAGFLSANLSKKLIASGVKVTVYSRSMHFDEPFVGSNYVTGELSDIARISPLLKNKDAIFFLSGGSTPSMAENNRVNDISSNLMCFVNLLSACQQAGVRRMIYASSGGTVYGESRGAKFKESDATLPSSTYGINKLAAELYLRLFNQQYGMSNISLRISNPVGPYHSHKKLQGAVNIFLNKILNNEVIHIWGTGEQIRDYVAVSDVVDAMIGAINYHGNFDTFNIGSGIGTSLREVISSIENISGVGANLIFNPPRSFDIKEIVLDISRANDELGWYPAQDFSSYLGSLYEFIPRLRNNDFSE